MTLLAAEPVMMDADAMDQAVLDYIQAIAPERRALFDRIHALVLEVHPDVDVVISYKMPTYVVGRHRLYVGVWSHGVSFYGWEPGRDGGFSERHAALAGSKGTIKVRPEDAGGISDDKFRSFFRAVLGD